MTEQPRAIEFTEQRLEMFPTRMFRRRYEGLEGFNRRMREIVLQREAESAGKSVVRSNVGGWHSDNDLLRWPHPEIQVLIELCKSTVRDYVGVELSRDPSTFDVVMSMEGWANVTRDGNYARPHVHPLANFALVYYVDPGDPVAPELAKDSVEGCIEFLDPRSRVTMLKTPGVDGRDTVTLRPRASTMLLFPAWIYHYVHPYRGQSPRISLACNVTVQALRDRPAEPSTERPSAVIIEE